MTAAAPTAQAATAVTTSTAKTLALRSAFTLSFSRTSATAASATPSGAHGLVDFTGPSGTITLELPGGPGAREQMVFLPGTVFVKPPSSSLPLQPGRPWIFANFADIAKYQVKFPPYIVQTEYVNPALTLSELAWGTTAASGYGKTVFQGVPTFHYRATVDLGQALARASGPAAAVFAQTIDSGVRGPGRQRLRQARLAAHRHLVGRLGPLDRGPGDPARGRNRHRDALARSVRFHGRCHQAGPLPGGQHRGHDPRRGARGAERW